MTLAHLIERSQREKESWKYTDVKKLLAGIGIAEPATKMDSRLRGNDEKNNGSRLVFVNGVWQPEQSRMKDLPPNIMQGDAASGYRLVLAGQTCLVTSPVELLFVTDAAAKAEQTTQLHIKLGASGRLTLIERHEVPQGSIAHIVETDIELEAQSKLVHGKIVQGGANAAYIGSTKIRIAEGAYYDSFVLIEGGKLVRNEIDVTLQGKLAQCNLNGVMLLRGHEHADTTTRITHAAPHGTSCEVYKSVVADKARAVFQGKIVVREGAQKTDSNQLSRALLLSDQAEMDAKPELEIYADDVKCSHGSTIGDLDAEAMFYLRSRGLNEIEARALLIRAFAEEMLDEIHVPELREEIHAEIGRWLDD